MNFAIASSTLPGDLHDKLQAVAKAGFTAVEIFEKDLLYSDKSPSDIRHLAESLGLKLISLQPFSDFEGLVAEQKAKALQRAHRKFHLMQELGTQQLLVTSSTVAQASGDPAHIAQDLAELADLAAKSGITIAYEPLPTAQHIRDIVSAFEVVNMAKRANLGLVLDSFAFFASHSDLAVLTPELVAKVFLVQLADSPSVNMDPQQVDRHLRCYAGQGVLPLVAWLQQLQIAGYQGILSHEVPCDAFRSSNPYQIARDGYRSLQWLVEQTQGAAASQAARSALLSGIEFVELACQGGQAQWMEQLLVALGFCKTHTHRSKDVVLYRQGQINFVINRERDGFANAYYDRHGTAVCALGLGTQHLAQVVKNCMDYRCDFIQAPHLPDELNIPAIRNVGDGLLYLVDTALPKRFFEVDFEPIAQEKSNPAGFGLELIDHVTQAVSSTEFLALVQFYQILFGLKANAEYDLMDRNGIVHSRSLVNIDHSVQLPVNTSQARESSTERFRIGLAGSGVQHIAFACVDIFAVAQRLNPYHILPISPNYYEEVQADFLLDDLLIEQMRVYNILYDANEQGEFFHIYTRHINGLFFEIVQRKGYQGFGERNAEARLAAQAREYQRIKELLLA